MTAAECPLSTQSGHLQSVAWPCSSWRFCRLRACGFISRINVDDVASRKRKLHATPKLIVLFDGVGVVVEDTKIAFPNPSTNEHPHALDGNSLLIIIYRDTEDQLRKVPRLKCLASLQIRKPERFRRFAVKSLTVL